MNAIEFLEERKFTSEELAKLHGLNPTTIRRMFVDEPGVIRLGTSRRRGKRQYFSLRIPASVAARVFGRLTVGGARPAA